MSYSKFGFLTLFLCAIALLIAQQSSVPALQWQAIVPVTSATTEYCNSSGAVNTTIDCIFTPTAGQRVSVRSVTARCLSAGTANLTVHNGSGVTFWDAGGAPNPITTALFTIQWPTGLPCAVGGSCRVSLGACGVGNQGWLSVYADRF